MAFELPIMPNFNTQPVTMPSPLDQYGKMLQLRTLQGQQALIPGQLQEQQQEIQAKTLENQQRQLALESQQGIIKAFGDPNFVKKFTGTPEAQASGLGFDPNAMMNSLFTDYGVKDPAAAQGIVDHFLKRSQTMAEIAKTTSQAGEADAAIRTKGFDLLHSRVADAIGNPKAIPQLVQDLVKNPKLFSGVPQDDLAHVYGALVSGDMDKLKAIGGGLAIDKIISDTHKAAAEAAAAQQKVIDPKMGMSPEQTAEGNKEVAVAKAEQPLKIQTAQAETQAAQLIKGISEPVYALVPQAGGTVQKQLMSKTDAIQAGLRTMLPVTEKEVGEDTMLINRLGDVRQKLARYEQSLSGLGSTITTKDQGNIAALIGKGVFKVGAFGTELPMDRLNAALQKENISGLSDDAKKLLVSYYNARESMQGYTRVLTGSGRSNEKAMELNLDALPNPGTADKSYATESLKQFRENLAIVGQGLPKIPGIKSPEEIEAQVTQPTTAAAPKKTKASKYGVEIQ